MKMDIVIAALVAAGVGAWSTGRLLDAVLPPQPTFPLIEVTELAVGQAEPGGGLMVAQTRMVPATSSVPGAWIASVVHADTALTVPGCQGAGASHYAPGALTAVMTLNDWVGSPLCEEALLQGGTFRLLVTHSWGNGETAGARTVQGMPFAVRDGELSPPATHEVTLLGLPS